MILNKLGPALAAGNTVVLKPDPHTPWNATRLGRLVAEHTDIPPGVVNVITTGSNEVAAQLGIDPRIDLVSFTGSTAVGKALMRTGAETMKRMFLELGGKSAAIILDDADLDSTLPMLVFSGLMNCGQACVGQTRILAPRSRYDEVVEKLAAAVAAMPVGLPEQGWDIDAMEAAFRDGSLLVYQVQIGKTFTAAPVTRDYLYPYEGEVSDKDAYAKAAE